MAARVDKEQNEQPQVIGILTKIWRTLWSLFRIAMAVFLVLIAFQSCLPYFVKWDWIEPRTIHEFVVSNVLDEQMPLSEDKCTFVIHGVLEGSAAQEAGLRKGDVVTAIDGVLITNHWVALDILKSGTKPVRTLTVVRGLSESYASIGLKAAMEKESGKTVVLKIKPKYDEEKGYWRSGFIISKVSFGKPGKVQHFFRTLNMPNDK